MSDRKPFLQSRNKIKVCRKCKIELTKDNWWGSRKSAGDYICNIYIYIYCKTQASLLL